MKRKRDSEEGAASAAAAAAAAAAAPPSSAYAVAAAAEPFLFPDEEELLDFEMPTQAPPKQSKQAQGEGAAWTSARGAPKGGQLKGASAGAAGSTGTARSDSGKAGGGGKQMQTALSDFWGKK